MGYRVLVNGVPVECDSVEEAMALAARVTNASAGKPRSPQQPTDPVFSSVNGASRWTEGRLREFLQMMEGLKGRAALTELFENPDGRTQVQLIQTLGLANGRMLSGVMAGLVKNAKKVGADPSDVYQREVVTIGGEKNYEYRLADSLRQAMTRNGGSNKN
jgi:hypothetical protein